MKIIVVVLWTIMVPAGSYAAASFSLTARRSGPTCLQNSPADSIQYKIIKAADNTYGYDISKNGKILIHQSSIPCIKGNRGFSKKKDAEKLAALVVEKIRKGESLPSVSLAEMKELGILF